jgi:regulation of enolase protein 1 (concanavalin A-like superfamily)
LWSSPSQWIKAGIEVNDGVPCLGAVVTDGYSDWSLCPVPSWRERIVTIRASRTQDAVIIRATAGGEPWRTFRVARFAPPDRAEAGPFLCSPERAGFAVRFVSWFESEPDAELHWLPPLPST